MTTVQARSKVWLEVDGQPLLGDGRERLLRLVHETGSISAAARAMGVSYRKAWTQLQCMEDLLTWPLLVRQKGGAQKGKTSLTPEALELLQQFDDLKQGVREFVDARYREVF
ncbi:MAG: winged helix-turn-helix domain-containing protein [Desulfuromonadales bacterium]|nr:winged helix-turn-helix domain-containing protein [Desulfuromonadales bacterium]MDW7758760.1 winged helix-turn-helix domain-containing protein [Desulfuromonadales bacterium]